MALTFANYGYILENGRVVLDGEAEALRRNEDVKEFYLGLSASGRRSYRDVKHSRRRQRWLASRRWVGPDRLFRRAGDPRPGSARGGAAGGARATVPACQGEGPRLRPHPRPTHPVARTSARQ